MFDAAYLQPALPVQATSAANVCRLPVQADCFQLLLHRVDLIAGDIGDEQVLPDGKPKGPAAVVVGDVGQPCASAPRSYALPATARRHNATTPAPRVKPQVAVLRNRRPRLALAERESGQREGQLLRGLFDVAIQSPAVEDILEACLGAVGAVAVLDEKRRTAAATATHSSGLSRTPVSRAKSLCPVMPPSCKRK